jgi:hypothetical protein
MAAPVKSFPPMESVQLTVVRGDSLYNICKYYLDTADRWKEIARINRLSDPHRIRPGSAIRVPVAYLKGVPLSGSVTFVQGDARVRAEGTEDWTILKPGDRIPPDSRLRTGTESTLEITYEDGSVFLMRSNTEIGVAKFQKTSTAHYLRDLYLGAGRAIFKVREATGEASRFNVRTPGAIASVRGTEFRVAVDETQKTFAEVMQNRIAVDAATKSVELFQGEGTMVKKGDPPLPPRKLLEPPSPVDLKSIYNTEPSIVFSRIEGARAYRVMVSGDREGKRLLREKVIGPGDAFKITGLADGYYYLLTLSIDPIGLEGISSAAHPFAIRVNPLPPMTQSPREGARIKGKTAAFKWLSVGDAARYHVQISENRDFSRPVIDRTDLKDPAFQADTLEYKPLFFRIRSIAADEYQGAWSDPLPFTLVPLPPTPAVDQPDLSGEDIHLRTRSVGEGFIYHFQIARDDAFKGILIDRKTDKAEITIKKPAESGVYFVRTAAIDRDGDTGAFSAPQTFEIKKEFPYEWIGLGGVGAFLLILLLAH